MDWLLFLSSETALQSGSTAELNLVKFRSVIDSDGLTGVYFMLISRCNRNSESLFCKFGVR